jgi:Tol biopolymer transport system component
MKKINLLFLLIVLLLPACGTLEVSVENTSVSQPQSATSTLVAEPTIAALATENTLLSTRVATLEPALNPLSMQSDSETIRLRLLRSYGFWNALWADATVTWYPPEGSKDPPQSNHEQVWISQADQRFMSLIGPPQGDPETVKVCDGTAILDMNLKTGQTETQRLPNFSKEPYNPSELVTDTVYPHPLSGLIGSPLSEMMLSSSLGQRSGSFQPLQQVELAGRQALIVDWMRQPGVRVDRLWIDTQTGVILRWQNFSKGGGDALASDLTVNFIQYSEAFPVEMFSLKIGQPPRFAPFEGSERPAFTPTPVNAVTPAAQPSATGEIYFTLMDSNSYPDPNLRLVRLPADCLIKGGGCPEPQIVPGYPNRDRSILPLAWSPDGKLAAVPYPAPANAERMALYIFNPADGSWKSIYEDEYIYDTVQWSPDGKWLAFMPQANNVRSIYVTRPDGSGLHSLSGGQFSSTEGELGISGWLGNELLFIAGKPGETALYRMRPDENRPRVLLDALQGKAVFSPSPRGQFIAFIDGSDKTRALSLMSPGGATVRQLASFQNGSIWPIVWSPDGKQLAFVVGNPVGDSSTLYLIGIDGSGLSQVYQGRGILNLAFAPDGQALVVEGDDATGTHLFMISLNGGGQQILQAPGLRLDTNWRGVSWRYLGK